MRAGEAKYDKVYQMRKLNEIAKKYGLPIPYPDLPEFKETEKPVVYKKEDT